MLIANSLSYFRILFVLLAVLFSSTISVLNPSRISTNIKVCSWSGYINGNATNSKRCKIKFLNNSFSFLIQLKVKKTNYILEIQKPISKRRKAKIILFNLKKKRSYWKYFRWKTEKISKEVNSSLLNKIKLKSKKKTILFKGKMTWPVKLTKYYQGQAFIDFNGRKLKKGVALLTFEANDSYKLRIVTADKKQNIVVIVKLKEIQKKKQHLKKNDFQIEIAKPDLKVISLEPVNGVAQFKRRKKGILALDLILHSKNAIEKNVKWKINLSLRSKNLY